MAIGKRNKPKQQKLWVATSNLSPRSGHPFYSKLNSLLDEDTFDAWLEQECAPYFAAGGRPSIPPGVYFRATRRPLPIRATQSLQQNTD
jgi:hypothetical protein